MNFPLQVSSSRPPSADAGRASYDPRESLTPRRLTMTLWDQAFVLRHIPGGSFEDHDRVLDETEERGYNTVRLDPMPQWVDLRTPDQVLSWPDPKLPLMPWCWNTAVEGPVGTWMIDFMEKLLARPALNYTLSAWWFCNQGTNQHGPTPRRVPSGHVEAAEMWAELLTEWKRRFGFDRLIYVDIANEVPYFLPGFTERFRAETGSEWWTGASFTPAQIEFLSVELNGAMRLLHREFPELRFTGSIHGDLRWLDVPLEFDCLDVHFYADADPRWAERTRFSEFTKMDLFKNDTWFEEFSNRCAAAESAAGPMFRARQEAKLRAFARWAGDQGMPLTTTESWATWFYADHPKLDWGWLLKWAEWSVDAAIANGMWGWTPHNYTMPQFVNWQDVAWHRRLNDRFLNS